jgi:hypothetical protein
MKPQHVTSNRIVKYEAVARAQIVFDQGAAWVARSVTNFLSALDAFSVFVFAFKTADIVSRFMTSTVLRTGFAIEQPTTAQRIEHGEAVATAVAMHEHAHVAVGEAQ